MEDHALEDDIDLSIITPDDNRPRGLDFSLNELLSNPKQQLHAQKLPTDIFKPQSKQALGQGSFMRDLSKLQKELSYETDPYDIYEPSAQNTHTLEVKQEETCTRTINSTHRTVEKITEADFKHLVIDFSEEKFGAALSPKDAYEDYFDNQILKTRKINERKPQKLTKTAKVSLFKQLGKEKQAKSYLISTSSKKSNPKNIYTKRQSKSRQKPNQIRNRSQMSSISGTSRQKSHQPVSKTKKTTNNWRINAAQQQYFGFNTKTKQKEAKKETQKQKTPRSLSKGKKIIFSSKNMH